MKTKLLTLMVAAALVLAAAGSRAGDQQVVMQIEGMTCSLCTIAVKKSLSQVQGVSDVSVSYDDKHARLTAAGSVSDAALEEAVRRSGPYRGKVLRRNPAP